MNLILTNRKNSATAGRAHGITAGAIALVAGLATPAMAQDWHWAAAGGNWSTPNNWNQFMPPPAFANVFIGTTAAAENGTVSLGGLGQVPVANVSVTDGMTLRNNLGWLDVAASTTVSGSNTVAGPFGEMVVFPSRLLLEPIDGLSFRTNSLALSNGARVDCANSFARINSLLTVGTGSSISGIGFTDFYGAGTTLVNNGTLRAGDDVGLRFRQFGGGLFDLDGTSGNGVLDLAAASAQMRFEGSGLADPFSGTIILRSTARLEMELTNCWTGDSNSEIQVNTVSGTDYARLGGTDMTFGGHIVMNGGGGWMLINPATLTLLASASASIPWNNSISTGTDTVVLVEGGTYSFGTTGGMSFHGPTTFEGGVFTAAGAHPWTDMVRLWDHTTWDGQVTFDCTVSQYGDATVAGSTVINASTLDMDGSGDAMWDINASLVVNAAQLNLVEGTPFTGTLDIGAGISTRLTINLDDPDAGWSMAGTMNLAGEAAFYNIRLGGSPVESSGSVNLASGRAQISADTRFAGGTLNLAAASSDLRMMGRTVVTDQVNVLGTGTLRNGVSGEMKLLDGSTLNQVGLVNQGVLEIGEHAGAASVDRLTMTGDSVFRVDIGGFVAGSEHDLLIVSGGAAQLAGSIEVRLGDVGGAELKPSIGDSFTVITSLGGISGTFDADPVTLFDGSTYHWTVEYTSNEVVVHLDEITHPCRADFDGSGVVDVPDIFRFLSRWFEGHIATDIDDSGSVEVPDIFAFLSLWFAGCE
jgi:hypothetical protein